MRVLMADVNAEALEHGAESVAQRSKRQGDVLSLATDVGRREEVERLKDRATEAFGEVAVLMNNAGRGGEGGDRL